MALKVYLASWDQLALPSFKYVATFAIYADQVLADLEAAGRLVIADLVEGLLV